MRRRRKERGRRNFNGDLCARRMAKNMDFNKIIERRDTYSIKYDPVSRGKPDDVLPMWVADMDFAAPACVTAALARLAEHGIFGYSEPDAAYFDIVRGWFSRRHNWRVRREWLVTAPGVVTAIYVAIRALTRRGDGVLIQQPVYYPFESAVHDTGRELLVNELIYDTNARRYVIDFDDFEEKARHAKLFVLCSPHNPVGRVWTRDELTRMGEICLRHNVAVIADEIWQDLVFPGGTHHVFAEISPELNVITATAPSKTFNLAGLNHANIFIPNEATRKKFLREYAAIGLSQPNLAGLTACKAAYQHGEPWLAGLIEHLDGNMRVLHDSLRENAPQIRFTPPEATYLAWLDFSAFERSRAEINATLENGAKLWLSDGATFGAGGAGFWRLNAACPREILQDAIARLATV